MVVLYILLKNESLEKIEFLIDKSKIELSFRFFNFKFHFF